MLEKLAPRLDEAGLSKTRREWVSAGRQLEGDVQVCWRRTGTATLKVNFFFLGKLRDII